MQFPLTYKSLLVILVILRYDLVIFNAEHWTKLCIQDRQDFGESVFSTSESCPKTFSQYNFTEKDIVNALNSLIGDRNIQFAHQGTQKIVLKRLATKERIIEFKSKNLQQLTDNFYDENRADGSFMCGSIHRFQQQFTNEMRFWLLMNLNVQPLILEGIRGVHFPQLIEVVGLTLISSYEGAPVADYVDSNFRDRLKISTLILKGVLDITNGSNGYRMYLTDLTFDNIALDEQLTKISFIDLDNVIIVDTHNEYAEGSVHVHQKIDCPGCFAYSPKDICKYSLSDLNLFATCQLLNEDLHGDVTKGFLHSVPDEYQSVRRQLTECVNCIDCDRFESAYQLIDLFETILNEL